MTCAIAQWKHGAVSIDFYIDYEIPAAKKNNSQHHVASNQFMIWFVNETHHWITKTWTILLSCKLEPI